MSTARGREKDKTAEGEPKKRGRKSIFTDDQKETLLKYYDKGMTSTNRHHADVIEKCARQCQTTVDQVKRFIGAENYKRRQVVDIDEAPKPRKRKTTPTKQKKGKGKGKETDKDEEEEEDQDDERFIAAADSDDEDEAPKTRKQKSLTKSKAKQKKGKKTRDEDDEYED